jgi:putative salt-induced outer membrane protein YdiY
MPEVSTRRLAAAFVCSFALVSAGPTAAAVQEEAPATADTVPDRWEAAFDLGFNGSTGNTRIAVLTTGFRIKHLETERYEMEWTVSYRYGESEGEVVARNLRSGLSYDLHPNAAWSPFLFVNAERDAFRKLDMRTNAGAGLKRTFVDGEEASLSLSGALLHDYEDFTEPVGDEFLTTRNRARWSVRAKGHRLWEGGLRFEHVTFFQPVVQSAADYNIDSSTRLTFFLTDRIGVNVSYTLRRDSTPPPEVEHNDQILQAGVTVQL